MTRLAIITTHPIQYNAPLFEMLEKRKKIQIKVFYTWGEQVLGNKYDHGFKRKFEWDIPLLKGYDFCFASNVAAEPGSHHFKGIDNPALASELESWGASAILVYGWNYKSHLKLMRFFKGKIPVIFRGDSTLINEAQGIKRLLRRIFLRWIYRHIDLALYVGQNNKSYYKAHGVKEKQLRLAPHAIDNDRFQFISTEENEKVLSWKKELGFGEGDFVLLFAGKLEWNKNPEFLISLANELKDHPDIKFLIVGNGHLEDMVREKTTGDPRFVILPFQNQSVMPLVYRLGDALILPSNSETWGLALNEAMACGLPVLASSRCGGAIDLIEEGVNGIVFEHNDITSAKNFILKLHSEPGFKEKAGKMSQRRIEKFSFAAVAEALESACLRKG